MEGLAMIFMLFYAIVALTIAAATFALIRELTSLARVANHYLRERMRP
jgi:hypothetical protein